MNCDEETDCHWDTAVVLVKSRKKVSPFIKAAFQHCREAGSFWTGKPRSDPAIHRPMMVFRFPSVRENAPMLQSFGIGIRDEDGAAAAGWSPGLPKT